MKHTLSIAALVLCATLRPWSRAEPPSPLAPDRPLASFLPERCRIFVDGSGLLPLLEHGLEHPLVRAVRTSPLGAALLAEHSPERALEAAHAWLDRPALPLIAALAGGGIGLGFDPAAKKAVLVALGRDADTVTAQLAVVFAALERQFGSPPLATGSSERWRGAEVWALGDDALLARRDALLVLGNERELVAEVLELAAEPAGRGLLDRPGFASHQASRASDAALWAWLELAEIEPHGDQGFRELRAANRTPAVQGLLGAGFGALLSARALSVTLSLDGDRGLELALRGFDAPCLADLAPRARAGEVPAELAGEDVGGALVYRDYARYFSRRTQFFPPEALPGFAEAMSGGALFFEGMDLGEDVLPRLSPWIRLVSREVAFAEGRRPEIPLPGLALVGVLDDERAAEQWTAAFQTAIALVNVDQAQKKQRSLRLHLAREGEIEISAASYSTPAPGDGVDMRYNLEPALAVVGRQLVLGTHEALVREIVRELADSQPLSSWTGPEWLELDARGLREVVEENFDLLVARKMLEDGLEHDEAAEEIGGLRLALSSFRSARVELDATDPSAPQLHLELLFARAEERR